MLPASYQLPAAIVLLVGGVVACFFGYRLFRIVLAIFGFILGAFFASSIFGMSDTGPMLIAAAVGGLIGAGILIGAYFLGVALIGAALGATAANLIFASGDRDPHFLVVVFLSITGATAAMYLQRYFIIVGAMAALGDQAARAAVAANDVWVVYPMNPAPGQRWVIWVWLALGAVGTGVQLGFTGGEKGRVVRRKKKSS